MNLMNLILRQVKEHLEFLLGDINEGRILATLMNKIGKVSSLRKN